MNLLLSTLTRIGHGLLTGSFIASFALLAAVLIQSSENVRASLAGAMKEADVVGTRLQKEGWIVRELSAGGLLREGETAVVAASLYAGNTYKIVAAGCQDAKDLDLQIFDEDGRSVGSERKARQVAMADFTPLWSGTFYVKIRMSGSTQAGAHYASRYSYRDWSLQEERSRTAQR